MHGKGLAYNYTIYTGFPGEEPGCQCRRHETQIPSLGPEDPLEAGIAMYSSILAWRIPWTEEPGRLESIGLHRRTRLKRLAVPTPFICKPINPESITLNLLLQQALRDLTLGHYLLAVISARTGTRNLGIGLIPRTFKIIQTSYTYICLFWFVHSLPWKPQ